MGVSRPKGVPLKKQIAGALVASLAIGSVPGWAEVENTRTKRALEEGAQPSRFRDAIDRAVDRVVGGELAPATPGVVANAPGAAGPGLTASERRDLDARRAALQTDPVARGTGSIVMLVVGTALSLGLTAYFIHKSKNDSSTTATAGMARR
jgi:hypothetical protein